jgi:hypothetical protein
MLNSINSRISWYNYSYMHIKFYTATIYLFKLATLACYCYFF